MDVQAIQRGKWVHQETEFIKPHPVDQSGTGRAVRSDIVPLIQSYKGLLPYDPSTVGSGPFIESKGE
jgi:hypothetical protein